jgi:hypothetical protein
MGTPSHAGRPRVPGVQAVLQAEGCAGCPRADLTPLAFQSAALPPNGLPHAAFSHIAAKQAPTRSPDAGADISPWHDIPLQGKDGTYNFVCEIPKETAAKMEVATVGSKEATRQALRKSQEYLSPAAMPWLPSLVASLCAVRTN